ncbi:C40 family peptidase [Kribbella sp. NBC_00709]|uniref:CHAP domain-containing protein n=1 Tax=Kribbella sp. NBC_00709 TaxID=2975972 RepID=UPI002E2AA334|nr:CHAP domain-containing protein [Kribbella sp. NBC_00709]
MIVKVTLAAALLAGGVGLMAPIALAASGTDTCAATPTSATPTDCKPPVRTRGGALPGADEAVARALRLVGSHGYYQLCARLAANIWGRPRAGYLSAAEQWHEMVTTNHAHPSDRQPPAGALVFWATGGPYGHVAVYVGNGRIVSNDIGDAVAGEGGVYLVDFGLIESQWGATYLGWASPIYSTT